MEPDAKRLLDKVMHRNLLWRFNGVMAVPSVLHRHPMAECKDMGVMDELNMPCTSPPGLVVSDS